MDSYIDLDAWSIGLDLVAQVYSLIKNFPKEELYGLSSQTRRASTSILLNIAEGFGRYTYKDKANKYIISRGECNEVEACLFIALRLDFINAEQAELALQLTIQEKKVLSGLIASCRKFA